MENLTLWQRLRLAWSCFWIAVRGGAIVLNVTVEAGCPANDGLLRPHGVRGPDGKERVRHFLVAHSCFLHTTVRVPSTAGKVLS